MKYNFQKLLPLARRFTPKMSGGWSSDSYPQFKVKNRQSREVMHVLKSAGYDIEGEVVTENNTTYGMCKGNEHIVVSDSGKYPFFLGDTTIRIGCMTNFYRAPINVR